MRAKKGDVRDISNCRRESIQSMAEVYSRENINVLLTNAFEKSILEELEEEEVFCLVLGEELIGTVSLDENQISGLYVKPKYALEGYSQKLLEFIEAHAKEKGILEVYLYSTLDQKEFYLHNGYHVSGIAYSFPIERPTEFVQMKKIL